MFDWLKGTNAAQNGQSRPFDWAQGSAFDAEKTRQTQERQEREQREQREAQERRRRETGSLW